jgi:hypothetical protein
LILKKFIWQIINCHLINTHRGNMFSKKVILIKTYQDLMKIFKKNVIALFIHWDNNQSMDHQKNKSIYLNFLIRIRIQSTDQVTLDHNKCFYNQ